MKKLLSILTLALFLGFASTAGAQEVKQKVEKGAKKTGNAVEKGAKKTGHVAKEGGKAVGKGAKKVGKKSAEVGVKSKAKVTDKQDKTKQGPNGETIYVDGNGGYYWIDKGGNKHYLPYGQLKDRN